jgi:hypothetical protein
LWKERKKERKKKEFVSLVGWCKSRPQRQQGSLFLERASTQQIQKAKKKKKKKKLTRFVALLPHP